jgi:hypothetical protein
MHLFIAVSYSVRAASISLPHSEGSTSYRHRILKKERGKREDERREKREKEEKNKKIERIKRFNEKGTSEKENKIE